MQSISQIEKEIINNWKSINAFEKSVSKRSKSRTSTSAQHKGNFVFYEGPPTANGKPGLHHVLSRSFKDVICRYKTMRGYRVERRAGWDTHGLPVEIQVEKELGLKNKKEVEKYGIAKFNQKCKESVWKYKQDWEELTERMGFWIDIENPYITYDPLYMESLWWIIKQARDRNLLYKGYKVIPRCTRCGTGLSSHEVAQGYKRITENSVIVKFKIKSSKTYSLKSNTFLLAWTTTPWTLPGNVALAIGDSIKYQAVSINESDEIYILAADLVDKIIDTKYEIIDTLSGKDLASIEYEPLFDIKELKSDKSFKTYVADFVTTEEGTGIVHTAVMYGEDDYNLGEKIGLPKVHTVDENGLFNELVKEFKGKFVKTAEPGIIDYLKSKNLVYKVMQHEHDYPFCWRCSSPLLYYAMHSWFLRMSELKKDLIFANRKINWIPDYIKEGRFGEWLNELKDWAFSRSRYWGTPLPIWECQKCSYIEVIGSRNDIASLTTGKNRYFTLRHGFAETNSIKITSSEYPETNKYHLMPQGIKDVEKSAEKLKKIGIDIIIASPITRTKETAEIVSKKLGVKVVYDKRVLELGFGIFNNKPIFEYLSSFDSEEDRYFRKLAGGESPADAQRRIVSAIDELEKKYNRKNILIISHGDPIWLLESAMLGLTPKEAISRRNKNYPKTGGLREFKYAKFPYNKVGELDFHRPYIDKIKFSCTECKSKNSMERVEDLIDVWFDSGAMPFAQAHYPFENKKALDSGKIYPAELISEAIDQTRGWFYTLLAVSGLIKKAPSFKNVISLGHVLDEKGQKMSKSKGNIVDPLELAEKYGMDAVRWYFFTINSPGDAKRFSENDVKERWQKFISTFLNSHIFLKIYSPSVRVPTSPKPKYELDNWILACLKQVQNKVIKELDNYNVLEAARILDNFVMEDLSNWYIRRSRSRLQRPLAKKDKNDASECLAFILSETTKLIAPFAPFISEFIWQDLNRTKARSVHWEIFPASSKLTKKEEEVLKNMQDVRLWASEALRLRSEKGLKVRQPLSSISIPKTISQGFQVILMDEVNVRKVKVGVAKKVSLDTILTPDLQEEGRAREIVRHIQNMRKDLNLSPQDKISISYSLPQEIRNVFSRWEKKISQDVNAKEIKEGKSEKGAATSEFMWDGIHVIVIAITKIKSEKRKI